MTAATIALALLTSASLEVQAPTEPSAAAEGVSFEYRQSVGLPLFAGAIASVALPPLIYKTPPACRWCDGAVIDAVDRWTRKATWDNPCRASNLSYLSLGAAAAIALVPMSHETTNDEWLQNSAAVADSVAATVILTQMVKYTVRRARPEADTCHPGRSSEPDRNLSFFSGHTAIAFALVSSAHEMSRLRGEETSEWVWVGGGVAAVTGYLRMAGGRHHLLDVLTGAGVGYFMGRWIPRQVMREKSSETAAIAQEFRPAMAVPLLSYSRPGGAAGDMLLQVGKGPGRSVQFAVFF